MLHPVLTPAPVLAATTTTVPDVSVGHALLQMVLALAVIVVGIWGLSKVLARLRSPKSPRTGANRRVAANGLTVLSRQALGKDLSIATVRWNGREVLVGISGSTITFLNDAPASNDVRVEEPASNAPENAAKAAEAAIEPAAVEPVPTGRLAAGFARPSGSTRGSHDLVGAGRPSFIDSLRDATLRR